MIQLCENEGVMNDDSARVGEVNYSQAVATASKIPEESEWSKCKRVPQQLADTLNGCLCGVVLDRCMKGVLKCKQASCET